MNKLTKIFAVAIMSVGFVACGPANNQFGQFGANGLNGFNQFGPNGAMMGGSSCISQAQQALSIGFSGSNFQMNSAGGFYAGNLPQTHARAGQYGTVSVTGGGAMNAGGGILLNKQSMNGAIQLSLNPQTRTISGMIQVNPQGLYGTGIMNFMYSGMNNQYQYQNQYQNQYQYQMPGQMPGQNPYMNQFGAGQVCVTSIGLDVVYDGGYNTGYGQSNGTIRSALVYLYLSNGQVAPMPVTF